MTDLIEQAKQEIKTRALMYGMNFDRENIYHVNDKGYDIIWLSKLNGQVYEPDLDLWRDNWLLYTEVVKVNFVETSRRIVMLAPYLVILIRDGKTIEKNKINILNRILNEPTN